MYKNKYGIALDIVENLGLFVEIEVKKYEKDIMIEYENLLNIAKELNLNLNAIDKKGYPYYFIGSKIPKKD